MAITATDRGTGADSTPGTTTVIAPSGTMAIGSTGILVLAMDNASGAGTNLTNTTSYTDSVGNVWYLRSSGLLGVAGTNVEAQAFTSLLTHSFTTGDTLTISFSTSTTAKAWSLIEASSNLSGGMVGYLRDTTIQTSTNTASPTINSGAFLAVGDLVVGMGFAESPDTWVGDADTLNGSWSTMQHNGTGSAAAGISVITQTKVVTAHLTVQVFNPTLTLADVRLGMLHFRELDSHARSSVGSSVSETTANITLTLPMATGSIGVLCMSLDNSVSGGATVQLASTFTDSKSNTWTRRQNAIDDPGVANAGCEIGIYTSVLTTPLVVGDTITWSVSTTTVAVKCWVVMEFAPTGAGSMTYVTGGVTGSLPTTPASSLSITTGSITSGDYVVACLAAEAVDNMTGDSDTTNGTWSVPIHTAAGTALASGQTVYTQWKKVTSTATQTYDVTSGDGNVDYVMGWVQINDSSPTGGLTASQKSAFFQMF